MKCDKVRDLILVGYTDGILGKWRMSRIKKHLLKCKHCRRFEVLMFRNVIFPFRHTDPVTPPSQIWNNLSSAIYEHHEKTQRLRDNIKDDLDGLFVHPVAASVTAMIVAFVLIFGVLLHPLPAEMQLVNDYLAEHQDFVGDLDRAEDDTYLDTALEDYFIEGNFS